VTVQGSDGALNRVNPVPVPRALKHSFSSRIGFPRVAAEVSTPPPLARVFATWLQSGSVLVVSAPHGSREAISLAAWLRTRAERILWVEGSELRESGEALDVALDGLHELGVMTRAERRAFTHLWDASAAIRRENTPIVLVVNDSQLVPEIPSFEKFAELAFHWPNVRFAFITDVVSPGVRERVGVTLVDADYLRDPLGSLSDLSAGESGARAQVVRDWAQQRDPSGGLLRLMLHLTQKLSVRRDSEELQLLDDLDAAIGELRERSVIELLDTDHGQRISLVPEIREALNVEVDAHQASESRAVHVEAARVAALAGDEDATIFHLARSGRHQEALTALAAIPLLALRARTRIDATRSAAAAIDIHDPGHSVKALALRLQMAMVPPLESLQTRDSIQDALRDAQDRMTSRAAPDVEIEVTIAHVSALIARGRSEEARMLAMPLAESLLALPWLDRRVFGASRIFAWTVQATADVLEGRMADAARFARVAQEAAVDADIPYVLYMATAALAAIEAQRGDLIAAEQQLTEAQRLYRKGGWPRSVAQTVEFVARYYLARAALDVGDMIDLRVDISIVPDPSPSMYVLINICDCFVLLHTNQVTQTRVAVRHLAELVRDLQPGAIFRALASELTFEALLRFGEFAAAIELIETSRLEFPDAECVAPLLGSAYIALGDGVSALSATEECARHGSYHSLEHRSLLLLVRAAAHELLGDTQRADEYFEEALLTQEPSPMPYLFFMLPSDIRAALWPRVSDERQAHWTEVRRFLATLADGAGRPDETLPRDRLTAREMEILRVLSSGGTLEEIAAKQYVSRNTVKTHVRLIYKKLHVNSRAGAAHVLQRFGEQLAESSRPSDGSRTAPLG
jgi:DNA-binding CsgD family transcriptional regulator/tetratricopeptide (TPR) repeat protein